MRYQDPRLRDLLAAQYVLGTLNRLPRARFQRLLHYDPTLRHTVEEWEAHFLPMTLATPEIRPSEHVWQNIKARIEGPSRQPARPGFLQRLSVWRSLAVIASVAAVVLGVLLMQEPPPKPTTMVVVMNDKGGAPRIAVSWLSKEPGKRTLRVRVMGHQQMTPDTSWELWCLPGGGKPPQSMGLINTHADQTLSLPRDLWPTLDQAEGLAMSVEPKGGSPTGAPTGPVLFSGARVVI